MKMLRKCIGSEQNFQYRVITYELHPLGKVAKVEGLIPCSENYTSIRRLEEDGNFEMLTNEGWVRIPAERFAEVLYNHKNKSVVRRRDGKVIKKKEYTADDILQFGDHSIERLGERFIKDVRGMKAVLRYVFKYGKVIPNKDIVGFRPEMKSKIVIYEKDLDMVIIAHQAKSGKLTMVTIYSTSGSGWFFWWLKNHKEKMKSYQTLAQYAKEVLDRWNQPEDH